MRFLALLFSFISLSAFACPQLSGSYSYCRSLTSNAEVDRDVVVSQAIVQGSTEYTVSATDAETNERATSTVRADGINRTEREVIPDLGVIMEFTSNANCINDTLVVNTSVSFDGSAVGTTISRVWKDGAEMHQETKGEMFGQEVDELVVCQ